MNQEVYIVLYAPSSVQKLLDFLKAVYTSSGIVPVVVKPYGAAAQVGVPEAHRISYKMNKPLIVLPELSDLKNILGCNPLYYVSEEGEEIELASFLNEVMYGKPAIIISSGEQEPGRKELEGIKVTWIKDIPPGMPSTAITGILVYEITKLFKSPRRKQ